MERVTYGKFWLCTFAALSVGACVVAMPTTSRAAESLHCQSDVYVWAHWKRGERKLLNPLKATADVDGLEHPLLLVMDKDKSEVVRVDPWGRIQWTPGKDFGKYDVRVDGLSEVHLKISLKKKGEKGPAKAVTCQFNVE